MRLLLPLAVLALALPACARYGPIDPSTVPAPVTAPAAAPAQPASSADADLAMLAARPLVMPVAGVESRKIQDSFNAGRDGGARRHNAIDIMAPHGTPVVAADSGRILRLSTNALGGITIYATDPGARLVYYYAHLARYHERVAQGMTIAPGDTLGFVGSTGNASPDYPHLHFQVMRMPADGRYWNGEPLNPFPVLAGTKPRPADVRQAGSARESAPRRR